MMMEPAQGREVLSIRYAAVGPGHDVMRLEAVSADTAFCGADTSVTGQDEPAKSGWDGTAPASHVHRGSVRCAAGDFDDTVTQDRFYR